jgi:CheY-like chemotaxis protein
MDHIMPELNGIETMRIIRNEIGTDYTKNIPVIILAANTSTGDEEKFLQMGFQAFMQKPIDPVRLDSILREWVYDKKLEAMLTEDDINPATGTGGGNIIDFDGVPGLDIQKGLTHFGSNKSVYLMILRSYINNTLPLLEIIKNVSIDNIDKYIVTVHGIKGSNRGIFASQAGDMANALEKAAVAGDFSFIQNNNQAFLDTTNNLIMDIEKILERNKEEQKPIKNKPSMDLLVELHKSCRHYDIDAIDGVMEGIERFEYDSDDGLAAWLRDNLDQGKYKDVREKLADIIGYAEE